MVGGLQHTLGRLLARGGGPTRGWWLLVVPLDPGRAPVCLPKLRPSPSPVCAGAMGSRLPLACVGRLRLLLAEK